MLSQEFEKLLKKNGFPEFHAPDSGKIKTDYCCSFHWFRLPDERIIGLDIVRSEYTGQLSLRAFLIEENGDIRSLVYEAPITDWEPFETKNKPKLNGRKPVLS